MRNLVSIAVTSLAMAGMLAAAGASGAQDAPGLACPPAPLPAFTATIDGQPIALHEFNAGSFGIFAVTKPAVVEIHTGFDVRWVDLRPLSAQITPVVAANHREIRIPISGDTPLTIEFNDDLGQVVHLFPYTPGKNEPRPGEAHLRYFGAGVTNAGLIEMKSGDRVYLAQGAWVKGMIRARNADHITIEGPGVLDGSEIRGRRALWRPQPDLSGEDSGCAD